jgi:hypothetical protein
VVSSKQDSILDFGLKDKAKQKEEEGSNHGGHGAA